MSKTNRPMKNEDAWKIGHEFIRLVGDGACRDMAIAGSTRRKKAMVNDIEIVALPYGGALWDRLDTLVHRGEISKALYGEYEPRPKWNGKKQRGCVYQGKRIEVFCANEHNWGYILWLRTGPDNDTDKANTMVATQMKYQNPYGIRLIDGVVMWGGRELSIPTENAWFELLGLDFIPPEKRTTTAYAALNNPKHQWGNPEKWLRPEIPKLF